MLGALVTAALLALLLDLTPPQAAHWLGLGVAAGLLVISDEAPGGAGQTGYLFRHALVQEVVLSTLTRPRRKELHRRAFEALAALPGAHSADAAPTLTRHALAGECWEAAAGYAVKSMARAVSRSANREALRLFDAGIDAARRVPRRETALALELGLLLEAIGALVALGQMDSIYLNLQRADAIAMEIGDLRCRASVAMQMSLLLWMRGGYTEGLERAEQALAAGRRAGRRNLQLAAGEARLMLLHGLGRYAETVEEARELERDFEADLRVPKLLPGWATAPFIALYAFKSSALWRLGDVAMAQEVLERAYAFLADFDHPFSRGLVDTVQGQVWLEQGRHEEARELLEATAAACVRHDVPTLSPMTLAFVGAALAHGGRAAEAVSLLDKGLQDRVHAVGGTYGEMFMRLYLGVSLRGCSEWQRAIDSGQQAVDLALASEQHGHRAEALYELGETLRLAGYLERARRCFEQALALARECGMPHYVRRATSSLAQLCEPAAAASSGAIQ